MTRALKWIIAIVVGVGVIGLAVFAFVEGQKEIAQEREREEPIKTPPRTSRGPGGEVIVRLDRDTQARVGSIGNRLSRSRSLWPLAGRPRSIIRCASVRRWRFA